MNKQILLTSLLILVIVGLISFIVIGSKNKNSDNNEGTSQALIKDDKTPIFFYGNTCPHCADVETWMTENRIEEKVSIVKKEVYENQRNAQEMTQAAKDCGLPTDSIGVPFLYAEGTCHIGSPDVIGYLSDKAGLLNASESAERSTQ